MKHNSLISANGFHNPIASTTIKSSVLTTIFKPLLLLFLLVMGSSVVWAWNVRGEGLPGLNTCTGCENWDSNIVEMAGIGTNTYCATFLNVAAESGNRYRLKICDGWKGTDNLDQSKSNVNFVDAGDKRISFTIPFLSNVFVFYNSSSDKIWVIAVPVNASNYSGSNYIRQDLGLDASGWLNKDNGAVKLTSSSAYAKHVAAFVIPKGMQWRYQIYNSGGTTKVDRITVPADGSATRLALVVWDGSSSSASVTLMPYVIKKSGWKLYVDDVDQGTVDANGDITVSNMPAASHTFYFTNGEGTTYHGINYFGGCYVNTTVSSSLFSNHQYYKTSSVGTFEVPTIDTKGEGSNAGYYMFPKGKFTLTGGAKDVTFNFDGGVITINAVDHGSTPEPPTPSGVTFDGTEYFFWNTNVSSWGTVLAAKDRTQFLQFKNTTTNATAHTNLAFLWEQTGTADGHVAGILAATAPEGTWDKVRHCRVNADSWNEGAILGTGEGSTDWIDLQEGNYMYKDGTIRFTTKSADHFKFFLSGTVALAGGSGEFNPWNGNGTLYTDNVTKTLEAGLYKFKINPDMTIYDNRGGVNKWSNEFNMDDLDATNSSNNINLRDGNNKEIWFDLANRSQVTIACDGSKVTVVATPVQQYTVTFNTDEGSIIDPVQVSDGSPVAQPADPTKDGYTFVKWQLNGSDYNFSNPVTGNITLDAVWAYKAISSVALNESEHTTWVGNSDFVLTLTKNPSDLITKSVVWSSDNTSAASVSNGTVHAAGVGTATITCTVTDMFDHVESASCEVSVAACEMTTDNLYSMTVTSYNSKTGDNADLSGLWNESSDNDGPEYPIVKLKLFNNYYVYDDNGTVKMSTDASLAAAQWYEIPTNENFSPDWTGSSFALYEFKNVSTGKYLRRGAGRYGDNGDWYYYTTLADNRETDGNIYKFFYDNTLNTHLVCREGVNSTLRQSYAIHNNNLNWAAGYSAHCAAPMVVCGYTNDPEHNAYTWLHARVLVSAAAANFIHSQMNSSYYRMKENATVRANLANGLAYGSVITVRLYADAATSVKLQTAAGDDVETINLSADAAREYTYTVTYGSELVGATAFIIKAADNHAGIASIEVSRMHAVDPSSPVLTWETDLSGGVSQSALAGTFQHVASSALSLGAIHYVSSDPSVATVAADGTVTPIMAGSTTITATIEAEGCYDEASIDYDVTLTEASLQEAINATAESGTLTLTHDYNDDAVINKAITINGGGHTIGDLKIEDTGDLTLSSGLTVRDFTICAKAGNTSIQAASGQVRNAANLTCNGNAYFLYTVDPSGQVHYGWYDFTVPFPVNVMTGIKGIQDNVMKENFANEVDYAIMEYLGERKAQGQYPYQKFRGVMQPNQLYSITLDSRYNYNTVRFQKTADGELVAGNDVTLHEYAGSGVYTNLNGVGNGTLHHADAGISGDYVQVYQSGEKTFLTVEKGQYSFVVGTAFMVQEKGTMTLNQATHDQLLAPARQASAPATAIQIAREGQPFSDQLFISASETGGQAYTPGTDLAKAGDLGSANVPQIWTNAYNNPLCVHEAQLINGEASYNLSIYAPAADTYTLTSQNIPADYSLYLTQNGTMLTELSGTYTLDLNKGITTEYGLLLVETYKTPTGMEEPMSQESRVKSQKILHNGVLYILHNGKIYNAQGGKVCDL